MDRGENVSSLVVDLFTLGVNHLTKHLRVKLLNLWEIYSSHNKANQSDYLPNSQRGLLSPVADPLITVVFVWAAVYGGVNETVWARGGAPHYQPHWSLVAGSTHMRNV